MFKFAVFSFCVIFLISGCASREASPQIQSPQIINKDIGPGFYRLSQNTSAYENPDLGSRRVEHFDAGSILEVIDIKGAFAQIKYSENAGWIKSTEAEHTHYSDILRVVGKVAVKESPSLKSNTIFLLESGSLVTLKKESSGWLYIKVSDNRAWVLSGLLEPLGTTNNLASPQKTTYWEIYKKSNLRSSPSLIAEILRIMPAGASVKYLGREGEWVHIEYDGTVGYVHSDLVGPNI